MSLDETIKERLRKYRKAVIFQAACSTEPGSRKLFWTSTASSEYILQDLFK